MNIGFSVPVFSLCLSARDLVRKYETRSGLCHEQKAVVRCTGTAGGQGKPVTWAGSHGDPTGGKQGRHAAASSVTLRLLLSVLGIISPGMGPQGHEVSLGTDQYPEHITFLNFETTSV